MTAQLSDRDENASRGEQGRESAGEESGGDAAQECEERPAPSRVVQGGGLAEENEAITVHEVALDDLARRSDAGEIADMKTLTLVFALRLRHPHLFASA